MWTYRAGILAFAAVIVATLYGCAMAYQDRAQQMYAHGRYEEAGYEIQATLANDPNNLAARHLAPQIFTQQGAARYRRGEMIAAQNNLHRAIDYEPTYAQAYDYLGLIAFSQSNWQDAIKYGGQAAGYSGTPEPMYVRQAREQLQKVRSGQLFVRPSKRR